MIIYEILQERNTRAFEGDSTSKYLVGSLCYSVTESRRAVTEDSRLTENVTKLGCSV